MADKGKKGVIIDQNLTVKGQTTYLNVETMTVTDNAIELNIDGNDTSAAADGGGGIILKGTTDKTITWSSNNWTSNQDFNLVSGKAYKVNNVSVLNATTLGGAVVNSSLTNVGSLTALTMAGNILPDGNNTRDIGASGTKFANVYATTFTGNLVGTMPSPGSNTQVLFNNSGTISGDAGLTFNASTDVLTASGGFTFSAGGDLKIGAVTILGDTAGSTALNNIDEMDATTKTTIFTGSNTTLISEGTNLYYTDARADARVTAGFAAKSTTNLSEGSNLYYTNARADARIGLANLSDLVDVHTATPTDGQALSWDNGNSRWTPGNAGHSTTDTLTEGSSNLYFTNARADARITSAGVTTTTVGNWNTAYTATNAATDAATVSTIVKRSATGNISASTITADNGVILGNMPSNATGGMQWTGTDFQGFNGSAWVSLTGASVAYLSGNIATFTSPQVITSTTYIDVPGYTTAITTTDSSIINIQVAVDARQATGVTITNVKLVRVVGGTPTDLYVETANLTSGPDNFVNFNIAYADTHGQSSGVAITYKIMAKVNAGSMTVNPDSLNAQIFVYEINTTGGATSSNTPNTLVLRDAGGDFEAQDVTIHGDLTVLGTNTIVEVDNLSIEDAVIQLARGNTSSSEAYIGLQAERGATDAYFVWEESSDRWRATTSSDGTTHANANMQCGTLYGNATSANYADLAERYHADNEYSVGSVVVFGGKNEITSSSKFADHRVAGVVSADPAYLMNATAGEPAPKGENITHPAVALRGKVPVMVVGKVNKGDLLVTSEIGTVAQSVRDRVSYGNAIFAKSIENNDSEAIKSVMCVII